MFVTIQENQSWKWKHWGCTTPQVLQNISDAIDGDLELFDGYDELPEEDQTRVSAAIEEGHIADEDWKGVSGSSWHEGLDADGTRTLR